MSKATRRFIVNKVLEMLITLVVVTLISFLLVRLSPIDPAEAYDGGAAGRYGAQ